MRNQNPALYISQRQRAVAFALTVLTAVLIWKRVDRGDLDPGDSNHDKSQTTAPSASQSSIANLRKEIPDRLLKRDDPRSDGWDSEVLHQATDRQLKALARLMVQSERINRSSLEPFVTDEFTCGPLRPEETVIVFHDRSLRVARPATPESETAAIGGGPQRFAVALGELLKPFATARDLRVEVKQYRIEKTDSSFTTRVDFEASGTTADGALQQTGKLTLHWVSDGDHLPRISTMKMDRFEEVSLTGQRATYSRLYRSNTGTECLFRAASGVRAGALDSPQATGTGDRPLWAPWAGRR